MNKILYYLLKIPKYILWLAYKVVMRFISIPLFVIMFIYHLIKELWSVNKK